MRLSAHHATHGLEGTVRLLDTGEALHIRFPKGKFRAEAQVNIGGQRFETAFVLEEIEVKKGVETDMRIRLEAPMKAVATGKQTAKAAPDEKVELAGDGSPLIGKPLPMGAPPATRHLVRDGLPAEWQDEPAPRAPTARESRDLSKLEKQLGGGDAAPAKAPPKKKGR